jgi:hypothetical protein
MRTGREGFSGRLIGIALITFLDPVPDSEATGVGVIVTTELLDIVDELEPRMTIMLLKAKCALYGERNHLPVIVAIGVSKIKFLYFRF